MAQAKTREPVSVVVTVLDEVAVIGRLLDELLQQDQPADEIIVVDGGSNDGTPDVVIGFGGTVQLIRLQNANI
jgi:glycosyltransferase involved in cell wall biosynthesis